MYTRRRNLGTRHGYTAIFPLAAGQMARYTPPAQEGRSVIPENRECKASRQKARCTEDPLLLFWAWTVPAVFVLASRAVTVQVIVLFIKYTC